MLSAQHHALLTPGNIFVSGFKQKPHKERKNYNLYSVAMKTSTVDFRNTPAGLSLVQKTR